MGSDLLLTPNYLAESVEDVIKEQQDLPFRNLGDIVHALTRVISDSCILIRKASQDGRHNGFQIASNIILTGGEYFPEAVQQH